MAGLAKPGVGLHASMKLLRLPVSIANKRPSQRFSDSVEISTVPGKNLQVMGGKTLPPISLRFRIFSHMPLDLCRFWYIGIRLAHKEYLGG